MDDNRLLRMLSGGDLRSDGESTQVAGFVLENPELFAELIIGLRSRDEVIRGRTADALEKIGRTKPELCRGHLQTILDCALHDQVPMVRWHLAMLAGHLSVFSDLVDSIAGALCDLLRDESSFVVSWTIVSLCIISRRAPKWRDKALEEISAMEFTSSAAIRSKVRNAVQLLMNEESPFPKGWVKSEHLSDL